MGKNKKQNLKRLYLYYYVRTFSSRKIFTLELYIEECSKFVLPRTFSNQIKIAYRRIWINYLETVIIAGNLMVK